MVSFLLIAALTRVSATTQCCRREPCTMLAAAAMRLGSAAALPTAAAAAAAFAPACHTAFAKLAPSLVHLERFSASRVSLDGCTEPWRRLVQCPPPTACTSQILAGTHAGTGVPGQHCSPALFPCLQFAPKAAEPALAEEVSGKFCPAAAAAGSMQGRRWLVLCRHRQASGVVARQEGTHLCPDPSLPRHAMSLK